MTLEATLTVQGFGFSPDDALQDLERRCEPHANKGWRTRSIKASVAAGRNPYSTIAVHGYVATTTLNKEYA